MKTIHETSSFTIFVLIVEFSKWCLFLLSVSVGSMSGPQRHQGIFKKQSSNYTIPYSEQPGKEMIAIDVEGTLWPFEVDNDPRFKDPFTVKSLDNGSVLVGNQMVFKFPEVETTLLELADKGYVLSAVALTNSTYKVMALLEAFGLTKHFKHMEMASGPDKLSLITAICARTGILLQDVLYFEKDGGQDDVLDLIWKHVIIYCVNKNGLTKKAAGKGLFVFGIRPRKDRKFGPSNQEKIEKSNKNKCRPAYEKDGTEIEGFDYNATKIEYMDL